MREITVQQTLLPWMRRRGLHISRYALLVLLLIAAATLRLWNINWDQFQHVHPDERFIVWVADSISLPPDLSSALDPLRSTINPFRWPPGHGDEAGKPRNYAYGHFPLYLLVGVAHAAQRAGVWLGETPLAFPAFFQPLQIVGRHLAEYNYLALVGRVISTGCDLVTLLLVYGLAQRAYGGIGKSASQQISKSASQQVGKSANGQWVNPQSTIRNPQSIVGLLAAAAYAFAVLPIQLSHFYAVDIVLTSCVVAAVALAARWADRGGWLTWLGAGMFAGLAVGSKFSAILVALSLVAAAWFRAADQTPRRRRLSFLGYLIGAGGAALLAFVVTNPFAVIEFRAYASNILAQNAMVSGLMDAPYTRQFIGALPYWYFVQQLSQWGLGWPLGVVAWGGFAWVIFRFGLRRVSRTETIMLAWAIPYFVLTGGFHAKFLRYMVPLLPFLLIFGMGAALAIYRRLCARFDRFTARRVGPILWGVAAVIVAVVTVGWALAFNGVYQQEHPWIQTSRWIFSNIPAGNKLLTEHWDDALPLLMDEIPGRPAPRTYARVELPLYDPDTLEKLDRLTDELSRADYLILASNRLSAPLTRLRQRYPMTSQYYRLLFSGELGYTPVATFQAYPQLAGLVIPDDHADESFTVYDHPRVVIFANTGRLSVSLLRTRLGRYLPQPTATAWIGDRPTNRPPGHARYLPQTPIPDPQSPPLPVVADFRWNRFASENAVAAVFLWWLALSVLGWATWPLLFPLLGGLADRGYGLTRTAGWLLVGWLHWLAVSLGLWQNRLAPLALLVAGLVLAGAVAWRLQRRAMASFWLAHRRLLLGEEALFALAFLAFVGIRILNPDLWQPWNGGEKFMESAFLNAILRSAHFPPYDPYFAGGTLNYYYYGLYLVALLVKLTGIIPEVAFNLAIPALFALTALGIFSVGCTLARRDDLRESADEEQTEDQTAEIAGGGLAVVLALLMGNLDALDQFITRLRNLLAGATPPGFDYWASSRVIPQTINEFPFWTYLFADLHPHLIAMAFGVLVIGLAAAWVLDAGRLRGGRVALTLWLVIALGALGAINTWDLPTYFLLVAAALLLAAWRSRRAGALLGVFPLIALIGVAAVAAYGPFYAHYQSQVGGGAGPLWARYLGWVRAGSPLMSWVTVWGIPWALALSALAGLWATRRVGGDDRVAKLGLKPQADMENRKQIDPDAGAPELFVAGEGPEPVEEVDIIERFEPVSRPRPGRRFLAALAWLGVVLALVALDRPTAAVMALPCGLALPLIFRHRSQPQENLVALLLALGAAVVAGTELVYLRDFLEGGDWYRMNTLFKFSVPAWLLLGIASGATLPRLWAAAARLGVWPRRLWRGAVAGLILSGLLFLSLGIPARVRDRFPNASPGLGTLNGLDYMTVGRFSWPDAQHEIDFAYDYLALQWLLDHVSGAPVVAEAPAGGYTVDGQQVTADYYRAGGLRVASFTGFPTFVGQHQFEQRSGDQVGPRTQLGQEFFETTDLARTRELLAELRVGYVYVGPLERILFHADSLRKFDMLVDLGDLAVVYHNPQVTVYAGQPPPAATE